MTIEKLNELPDKELRVLCAELCGWRFFHDNEETFVVGPIDKWPESPRMKSYGVVQGDGRPEFPLIDHGEYPLMTCNISTVKS